MDLRRWQLQTGSRCRVRTEVLAVEGRHVVLHPPLPVTLVGYGPGQDPPPAIVPLAVPGVGIDLRALSERRSGVRGDGVGALQLDVWLAPHTPS